MDIKVSKDRIKISSCELVHKGEYKVNICEFTFSEEYTSNLVKMALFTTNEQSYQMSIINNACDIPYEVLNRKGEVILGVFAYSVENDELVLRYSPKPTVFKVEEGSYEEETITPEEITPSQFEQYMQALNDGIVEIQESLVNYYNKTETNSLLNNKQDKLTAGDNITIENNVISVTGGGSGTTDYTDLTNKPSVNGVTLTGNKTTSQLGINIPTDLSQLSNTTTKFVNETQLQSAIDSLGSVFTLKGSVATATALPSSGNSVGDVYYVQDESSGYVWINDNGTTRWEELGYTVDTSDFLTKSGLLTTTGTSTTNTMNQNAITTALNGKVNTSDISTSITSSSTNSEVAGAKAVYDIVKAKYLSVTLQSTYNNSQANNWNKLPIIAANENPDFTVSNGIITCNKDMTLLCMLYISPHSNGSGRKYLALDKNTTRLNRLITNINSGEEGVMSASFIHDFAQGDEITLKYYATNTGDLIDSDRCYSTFLELTPDNTAVTLNTLNTARLMNTGSLVGLGDRAELGVVDEGSGDTI